MAQTRPRPADYTGRQREKLARENQEVVQARQDSIAMAQAAQAELDDSVHDLAGQTITQTDEHGEVTYVEAPARTIRVNSTIENMTFGAGNNYTFEEGKQYRIPAVIADHLEELGYVWH
jgi:hypothetical protein